MTAAPAPLFDSWFQRCGVRMLTLTDDGTTPVSFGDDLGEHLATRNTCGLFDFSFMGAWQSSGPAVPAQLTRLQTRDIRPVKDGQIVYTLMRREDPRVAHIYQ